jgi:hypothetical protein
MGLTCLVIHLFSRNAALKRELEAAVVVDTYENEDDDESEEEDGESEEEDGEGEEEDGEGEEEDEGEEGDDDDGNEDEENGGGGAQNEGGNDGSKGEDVDTAAQTEVVNLNVITDTITLAEKSSYSSVVAANEPAESTVEIHTTTTTTTTLQTQSAATSPTAAFLEVKAELLDE